MLTSGKVQDKSGDETHQRDISVEEDPVLDVRELEILGERGDDDDMNKDANPRLRKARITEDTEVTNNDTSPPKYCIIREKPMINVSKVPVLECSVR